MTRGPAPTKLRLRRKCHRELRLLAKRQQEPFVMVQRAKIALLAHRGLGTEEISRMVGCSSRNVRVWKARLREDPTLNGLRDRPRTGRPALVPLEVRCELIRLACERPDGDDSPAPFRDVWTQQALADALEANTSYRLSRSEVGRILRFEGLRPHRVKVWLKCQDPDFAPKAKRICDLYIDPPAGAVVVCVDEKPLQALERIRKTTRSSDGSVRYEFEYKRRGTQSLLAAFDTQTGRVFGRVVKRVTDQPSPGDRRGVGMRRSLRGPSWRGYQRLSERFALL